MILYQYYPFSDPKIKEVEAEADMPEHPEILTINRGTHLVSGILETLLGNDYSLTPRDAINTRIETQKRILKSEAKILAMAEKDLEDYPE
jgi:hypothetical protein